MFGFGTSENKTTTNVSNQQVATESGIALGANSTNSVSIMTADPEIAKASFEANVGVSQAALDSNMLTSALAIKSSVDTSKLFSEGVRDIYGTSAAALTSANQDNAALSNKLANLVGSFAGAAPTSLKDEYDGSGTGAQTTSVKKWFIIGGLLIAGLVAYVFLKRR